MYTPKLVIQWKSVHLIVVVVFLISCFKGRLGELENKARPTYFCPGWITSLWIKSRATSTFDAPLLVNIFFFNLSITLKQTKKPNHQHNHLGEANNDSQRKEKFIRMNPYNFDDFLPIVWKVIVKSTDHLKLVLNFLCNTSTRSRYLKVLLLWTIYL